MYLPMTREQWQEYQKLTALWPGDLRGQRIQDEAEVLRRNANWLLGRLYQPDARTGARFSRATLGIFGAAVGIADEAINWGDLSAGTEQHSDTWFICIEEAAPDCVNLCAYIEEWLKAWGWKNVEVETEW